MYINPTACCALAHLRATNEDALYLLKEKIDEKRKEARKGVYLEEIGGFKDKAQTSLFCVATLPYENKLVRNLKLLGFKKVNEFSRRVGYPSGKLEMYVLNLI